MVNLLLDSSSCKRIILYERKRCSNIYERQCTYRVKCEYKIEKAQATIVIIDSTRQSWEWTRVRITHEKFSVYTRRNYSDESSVYDLKEVAVTSSLSREPTMHYTCESIYLTASGLCYLLIAHYYARLVRQYLLSTLVESSNDSGLCITLRTLFSVRIDRIQSVCLLLIIV